MSSCPETLHDLSLAHGTLDRAALRRRDPELSTKLLASPDTRVLELRDNTAEIGSAGGQVHLHLRAPGTQDRGRLLVFLGEDGDHTSYLVSVAPTGEATDGSEARQWRTLREVGLLLDDRDAGLFAAGQGLANWHAAHTHCPRCGARTEPDLAGWVRRCTRDATEHYPRTDPAVIMSVTDADDRLLLARGPQWASGRFSVLAGFVEPGESLEAAVAREVREEVGLVVEEVRYLGNQPWPFPSSLMIGFTARVAAGPLEFADDEVVEAVWLTREELAVRVADGSVGISARLSIARRLIEQWYGGEIEPPAEWTSPAGRS